MVCFVHTVCVDPRIPPVTKSSRPPGCEAVGTASPVSTSASQSPAPAHDPGKGRRGRGRPRKHAPKLPLPPLYVFIRNLLHSPGYNPSVISWVDEDSGCFKVRYHIFKYVENFNVLISRLKDDITTEGSCKKYVFHF